jgi:hypothetical protein
MLRGWQRIHPSQHWPPLTWPLTVTIAATMCNHQRQRAADIAHYLDYAIATLIAFDCYMRSSEFTNLRLYDIALPGDPRLGISFQGVSFRLADTKRGPNQFVDMKDPRLSTIFSTWLLRKFPLSARPLYQHPQGPRIFSFAGGQYAIYFNRVISTLGLRDIGYVPHSLRGGGATNDFMRGSSIETILRRGRWESTASAKTYVQSGRARLLTSQAPCLAPLTTIGNAIDNNIVAFFAEIMVRSASAINVDANR